MIHLNYVLLEGHIHHLGIRNFTSLPTPRCGHLSFRWHRVISHNLVQRSDSAFGDAPTHQTSCTDKPGEAFSDCSRSYKNWSSKTLQLSAKFCLFSNRSQPRHDHRGRELICWAFSSTTRLLDNFCILVGNNNTSPTSLSQQWQNVQSWWEAAEHIKLKTRETSSLTTSSDTNCSEANTQAWNFCSALFSHQVCYFQIAGYTFETETGAGEAALEDALCKFLCKQFQEGGCWGGLWGCQHRLLCEPPGCWALWKGSAGPHGCALLSTPSSATTTSFLYTLTTLWYYSVTYPSASDSSPATSHKWNNLKFWRTGDNN